ncbi:MAG: BamA/TamA family outer membrane protein [bacterium]
MSIGRRIAGWIVVACFLIAAASGQSRETSSDSSDAGATGILPLPIFFYTPETGFAGGGVVMYFSRPSSRYKNVRPSTANLNFIYTEKKQIISEFYTDLYTLDNLYRVNAGISYNRFPQKFYGVGSNASSSSEEFYTSKSLRTSIEGYRHVSDHLSAGISYFYENRSLTDLEPDGLLAAKAVVGSNGGVTTGPGVLLYWDSRDNIFSPLDGEYHQASFKVASHALGSDFNFTRLAVDVRKFINLGNDHILVLQGIAVSINGTAPFHKLDGIGGQSILRGYYEGRYRDKKMLVAQAEYRSPMVWRFTGALFAGLGDVASTVSAFRMRDLKPSYGFGIRFFFEPKERLCIRMDFGFGQYSSGLYFTASEAY